MPARRARRRGEFSAGILGFRQGADGIPAKARQEGKEDFRREPCIRQGAMAFNHRNAEPGRQRFEGEVRQIGPEQSCQIEHVKKSRGLPGEAGALMLTPQHGEIKAHGITQNHMGAGKVAILLVDLREAAG